MHTHPLIESKLYKVMAGIFAAIALLVHWFLLTFYQKTDPMAALVDGLVSISLFTLLAYFLWYAVSFVKVLQAELILMLVVMTIWMAGCFVGQNMGEYIFDTTPYSFIPSIPFRLLFGILAWTSLSLWYRLERMHQWKEERIVSESLQAMQAEEVNDRIAVKDGSRIHIIHLPDLIYVQASGDYITLVSASGQYLKEQTMKSLESQLPGSRFVRVHRSYIVNVEYIKRVELHGKETYQVLLKNGETIRASSAGYKLLKEQLAL